MHDSPAPSKEISSEQWGACPEGTLRQLAAKRAATRRNSALLQVGSGVSVMLLLLAVGYFFVSHLFSPVVNHFGGIACTEVRALMPEYIAGRLDEPRAEKVRAHLDQCPHCEDAYRKMFEKHAGADLPSAVAARAVAARGESTPGSQILMLADSHTR